MSQTWHRRAALLLCGCWLAGCSHAPAAERGPLQPALLLEMNEAAFTELQTRIETALGGRTVRLSRDLFLNSSLLALEPPMQNRLGEGFPAGRLQDPPERFQLLTDGRRCYLQHLPDSTPKALNAARCRSETDLS